MTNNDALALLKIVLLSDLPSQVREARHKLADMMLDLNECEAEKMLREGVKTFVVWGDEIWFSDLDEAVSTQIDEFTSFSRDEKQNLDNAIGCSDGWSTNSCYDKYETAVQEIRTRMGMEVEEEEEEEEEDEEVPEGMFNCSRCEELCCNHDQCYSCGYCKSCCACV